MAIFVTGDTHGTLDVEKLSTLKGKITADDYILVLGDFGICWDNNGHDGYTREFWGDFPCTILFIDGNHENFTLLNDYPVEEWHGGKVHRVGERMIHLMRGQIFEIEGKTFFAMGGAASHDCGWILEKYLVDNIETFHTRDWKSVYEHPHEFVGGRRVPGESWWAEEIPSPVEIAEAKESFKRAAMYVDYILTHCPPPESCRRFATDLSRTPWNAILLEFLDWIEKNIEFEHWWFGHLHVDKDIAGKYRAFFDTIKEAN